MNKPMNKVTVFIIRLIAGLVGGFLLQRLFYPEAGWPLALILTALVILAAYASEMWRDRKKKG